MAEIDNFLQDIESKYQQKNKQVSKVNHNQLDREQKKSNNSDIDSFISEIESQKKVTENQDITEDIVLEIEGKFQQKNLVIPLTQHRIRKII